MINKIKRRSRWLINDVFYSLKSTEYWQSRSGSCIFIYHGVDQVGSLKYNSRFISQKYLEQQILFFKKYFQIVSIQDFVSGNFNSDHFTVVLTFDDGYMNNFEFVLPLLEKYEIPACFFITAIRETGYDILWSDHLDLGFAFSNDRLKIDDRDFKKKGREFVDLESGMTLKNVCRQEGFDFKESMMKQVSAEFRKKDDFSLYWKLVDKAEIVTMANSPWITIGSHGYLHNNYANVSREVAENDLTVSKNYLENLSQKEVNTLAYPDGSYNREIIDLADTSGYKYQFAVDYHSQADLKDQRVFKRLGLNPFIGLKHQAKAMIDGHY